MKTSKIECTTFIYNADMSGMVKIIYADGAIEVPASAIFKFVADHIRRQRISELEEADHGEILGIEGFVKPKKV